MESTASWSNAVFYIVTSVMAPLIAGFIQVLLMRPTATVSITDNIIDIVIILKFLIDYELYI